MAATETRPNLVSADRKGFEHIGKKVMVEFKKPGSDAIQVECEILDYKWRFGHSRYLVSPVSGSGQIWVQDIEI